MNEALMVEIFASNPHIFYNCMDCDVVWGDFDSAKYAHRIKAVAHLSTEQGSEYLNLATWVVQLQQQYGHRVHVHIIDVVSLEGVTKSIQYGLNSYPAVVIDQRCVYTAHTLDDASGEVAAILGRAAELS